MEIVGVIKNTTTHTFLRNLFLYSKGFFNESMKKWSLQDTHLNLMKVRLSMVLSHDVRFDALSFEAC